MKKDILESVFSSKTRTKLLNLFMLNTKRKYFVRELTRRLDERINSIRRELFNLEKIGLLESMEKDRKKFYYVDKNFIALPELKSLITKVNSEPKKKSLKEIINLGDIKYACYSGFFTKSPSTVDLLMVGEGFNRPKVRKFVKKLEEEHEREINYTLMSTNEYKYRKELNDRFLNNIVDNECIEIINTVEDKN